MEHRFSLFLDFRLNPTVNCCGLHSSSVLHVQHTVKGDFSSERRQSRSAKAGLNRILARVVSQPFQGWLL
jgi:hypothetical protein